MKPFVTLCLLAALVAVVTCQPEQQAAAEFTPDADQPVASEAGDLKGSETGIFGRLLGGLLGRGRYGRRHGYGGYFGGYPYGSGYGYGHRGYGYGYPGYGHGLGYGLGNGYGYGYPYYG
ncbi:shematrin-like protein 1 [Amphibalanus amphitrite]|uniref:shematrin-like protein 1 n=1 Tax=Amphibalanus amphitrite TaxID=1232801 RepID=UPI001C90F107|nr:shematrin-like protein 1 [Amphibalanus amphitrite]